MNHSMSCLKQTLGHEYFESKLYTEIDGGQLRMKDSETLQSRPKDTNSEYSSSTAELGILYRKFPEAKLYKRIHLTD